LKALQEANNKLAGELKAERQRLQMLAEKANAHQDEIIESVARETEAQSG